MPMSTSGRGDQCSDSNAIRRVQPGMCMIIGVFRGTNGEKRGVLSPKFGIPIQIVSVLGPVFN